MCKITKCCRCFGVRPGAYLIAILSVFRGIIFLIWFGYGILNGNWFLEDVIYKNIKSSLIELDQDISFTPHAYVSYCVCAVTILFITNDFALLMGLKKNHPIIMLIWLLIGGINRAVSKLFDYFDVKFIHSEKATNFCEIFTLLLTVCTVVKSKVKVSQNFVAFSEYMNFTNI